MDAKKQRQMLIGIENNVCEVCMVMKEHPHDANLSM